MVSGSDLAPASLFSCDGQVAIVTGGTTGLGLASAAALAAAGARVAIAGLPSGDPAGAAASLREQGLDVIGIEGDVTDDSRQVALVDEVVRRWGRIDTVLANAGLAIEDDSDSADALRHLDTMFAVHVRSVLRLSHLTLPIIAEGGGGLFLVMSSLSALRGNRAIGGYGITKAANAQLARNIAVQWGPRGVRANAIAPGVITTEFARPITENPDAAAVRLGKTPLRRFGTPREVAGAVVWLSSPAGAFVSGQTIIIDGGTVASD